MLAKFKGVVSQYSRVWAITTGINASLAGCILLCDFGHFFVIGLDLLSIVRCLFLRITCAVCCPEAGFAYLIKLNHIT